MSQNTETLKASAESKVTHRLTLSLQAKGNVGKSTEAVARCDWMKNRGIPFVGFDLDIDHKTLVEAFPDAAHCGSSKNIPTMFNTIFQACQKKHVVVVDPRAHMDKEVSGILLSTDFIEKSKDFGLKVTVMVYPQDEPDVLINISQVFETFGETVDYVIVKNGFTAPTLSMWNGSTIEKMLIEAGAKTLHIPALYECVRKAIAAAESQAGRRLSPTDILEGDYNLSLLNRGAIEVWRNELHEAYDEIANLLVPEDLIPQVKHASVSKAGKKVTRKDAAALFNLNEVYVP